MILDFEAALIEVMRHAYLLRASRLAVPAAVPEAVPEVVDLLHSAGRVLAEPILADRDQPPFDRATRDGYAVHAAEWSSGLPLTVLGQIRAGEVWQGGPLPPGQAIEIMTGAPVPAGADAVAMIEHAEALVDAEEVLKTTRASIRAMPVAGPARTLKPGQNFVARGSEARLGQPVVAAGSLMGPAEIALAATSGCAELAVFARPTVSIVATGDELVALSKLPESHQIRNSNSYALAALVLAAGGLPDRLEIAPDLRDVLRDRIAHARRSSLMLLSGGVSMGRYDLVEEVLADLGAVFYFTGVLMQPGKPLVFGSLPARDGEPECFFFGLPGNPISTQVTFHCFVEPFLRVLAGEQVTGPGFAQATLAEDVPARPSLMRFLPARVSSRLHTPTVTFVPWHGSGDLAANARASCYGVLPPRQADFRSGEVISILLR